MNHSLTADEALERLIEGNRRFQRGEPHWSGVGPETLAELARGQHPFATILGCSDSRVAPETIFHVGLGELFVVRVAGNVLSAEVAGSIQYAGSHLQTPLLVVLGHEGCGAIQAALATMYQGAQQRSRIQLLVESILPGLEGLDSELPPPARLAQAVEMNVRWTLRTIQASPEWQTRQTEGRVKCVGAIYELETGRVRFLDPEPLPATSALPTIPVRTLPMKTKWLLLIMSLTFAAWAGGQTAAVGQALAAESADSQPAATPAPPPSAPAKRSAAELEKLVAPIALYPDPLLATVLPASVYPLEIVQAARFVADTNNLAKLDEQPWDPNVKAVARVPEAIKKLNEDISWTIELGDAFLAQDKDIMDAIQSMRGKAQKAGTLQTSPQQVVTVTNMIVERTVEQQVVVVTNTVVQIQPSNTEVVYVPTYNPATVYYPPPAYYANPYPLLTFGAGMAVGAIIANNCDWHGGGCYHSDVNININNNFNRNTAINANGGSGATAGRTKWQPDQSRLSKSGSPTAATSARSTEARGWGGGARPSTSAAGGRPTAGTQAARPSPATAGARPSTGVGAANRPSASPSASRPSPSPSASRSASSSSPSVSRTSGGGGSAFSGTSSGASARSASSRGAASRSGGFTGGGGGRGGGGRR